MIQLCMCVFMCVCVSVYACENDDDKDVEDAKMKGGEGMSRTASN